MLCSSCSAVVKPIVAVDIDGTLGDYHGSFMYFAERYIGRRPSRQRSYDNLYRFSDWVCESFSIDLQTYRAIKLAYRQGANKRFMPIFMGAQALCWSIRDAGAELWITTTRPYLSLDNVVPDTVAWLDRHEIVYDGMLFDDDKYQKLLAQVDPGRVVAIFDDTYELCQAAESAFPGRSWMVMNAWNQGIRTNKTCDIDSAADIARNATLTWKGMND